MTLLMIPDDLAESLQQIAKDENTTVAELLQRYVAEKTLVKKPSLEVLRQMRGMITGDFSDASTTVKETVREYFLKKYADAQNRD